MVKAFKTKKDSSFSIFKAVIFSLTLFLLASIVISVTQSFAQQQRHQKPLRPVTRKSFRNVCDIPLRGIARCHARVTTNQDLTPQGSNQPPVGSYGPAEFHTAYNLPCTPGETTQSTCPTPSSFGPQIIAIVDAYHNPTIENDLNVYSSTFGLPPCTKANGCLMVVNQNGGSTLPTKVNGGWSLEAALDVEVAHAICQTCKILLVEANSNSILNLGIAVNTAANMGATAISNSYGAGEWSSETAYDSYYNHPGVAVTASSGDSGYGTEFPAASPNVVAVGGTTLQLFTDNTYASESVWNGSGSGCSLYEPTLSVQSLLTTWGSTSCGTKRGIADVAADADPNTGAAVYDSTPYFGSTGWWQVGGTSLSAPIIAAVYTLNGGVPAGIVANTLPYTYFTAANSHDILTGSNGTCTTIMCQAGIGYDGPTGLGSPNGTSGFGATLTITPTATPTPTLTPTPTATPSPTPSPTPVVTDTTAPTVTITFPLNNATVKRRTNIAVTANASDNVAVTKINFYRNGTLRCSDTAAPYSCSMLTGGRGQQITYKATAFDAAGNTSSNSVTVTVQ